ncbi:hypothetical protein TNCV_41381 [Trichonephila clavipes]|nr:hypothetical protein TNCV_41381 [Trichonephila clavipes]
MRSGIWQFLRKESDGAQHQTCLDSSLQPLLVGREGLLWIPELTCMSKLNLDRSNISGRHSRTTCMFVSRPNGVEFVSMDGNALPHRGNVVSECLQSEDITRMGWPIFSTDFNSEQACEDILG